MKNILLLLLLISVASCKTFDVSMVKAENDPLNPKLPALEKRIEDIGNASIVMSSQELSLITDQVERNIMDPYGKKKGSIIIMRKPLEDKLGAGWLIASAFTLYIANIFGMPIYNFSKEIEVEIRVLDDENTLIGKYSAIGTGNAKVAAYYGYGMKSAQYKVITDAYNNAFKQIRELMEPDMDRLITELNQ